MLVLPVWVIPGYPSGRATLAFSPLEETEVHPCAFLEMCSDRKDRDQRTWTRGLYQSPLIHFQSLEGSHLVMTSQDLKSQVMALHGDSAWPGRSVSAERDDRHKRAGSPLPSVTTSCGASARGFILGGLAWWG